MHYFHNPHNTLRPGDNQGETSHMLKTCRAEDVANASYDHLEMYNKKKQPETKKKEF